ncbi:MAG: hypothetical protein BGO01_03795 [Armatimonadetes bacterium 55-13]|nr:MAG: hypothetical protein BGO01_03795 [Armatimonadetes bacterium 55-13]
MLSGEFPFKVVSHLPANGSQAPQDQLSLPLVLLLQGSRIPKRPVYALVFAMQMVWHLVALEQRMLT